MRGTRTGSRLRRLLPSPAERDLVERTRWLFYQCVRVSLGLTLLGALIGADPASGALLVGAAAVLTAAWGYRYRSGRAPLPLDVVEATAVLVFTLACHQPATALGVAFSVLWFRAIYGRSWQVAGYAAALSAALVAALPLWTRVLGHHDAADGYPVLVALPVLLLTAFVARYLALSLIARGTAQQREAALAELGTRLLGVTDAEQIERCAWEAAAALCAVTPGMRVVAFIDTGRHLKVTGHAGKFVEVPTRLPRSCAVTAAGGRRLVDPGPLTAAAGFTGTWLRISMPDYPRAAVLVGSPSAVATDALVCAQSMVNQFSLALRTSMSHRNLELQALTDPLTGLPNRAAFTAALDAAVAAQDAGVWVLFVDLDDFKVVNDGMGHAAGDQLLRRVADRLSGAVRAEDLLARLGGDEFAVLLRAADADVVAGIGRRLVELSSAPVTLDGQLTQVGASVGAAELGDGMTATELVQHADIAMYAAKAAGKNRVRTFHPDLLHPDDGPELEAELRTALASGQITVAYQPILAADDGRCTAVEALVRWAHPTRGLLAPAAFLDVAERSGLIVALGEQVLTAAAADVRAWADAGHPVAVHVNASPAQLAHPNFVATVEACLLEQQLPAARLVVEITESAALDSPEARAAVHALAALGVGIAVDDFGTGYAALTGLRDLPVDIVKIDKSFVDGVVTDVADRAVLTAVAEMARRMGLQTVAEGVEDAEQQAFVVDAGIRAVQGYLHLPPVPAAELTAWLADPSRPRAAAGELAAS